MLKDRALYYNSLGKNCSQSIIYGCEDYFGIEIGDKAGLLFINGARGFGIGGMCNVAIACVMFLGVYFGEEIRAKQAGLLFLSEFYQQLGYMDCISLTTGKENCERVIACACDIMESVISRLTN